MNILDWVIKNIKKTVGMVLGLILLIAIALNSYTIVQPGDAKLGTLFGEVQDNPLTEGFHIVNPLASFDTYSIKDFTATWDNVKVPAQDKLKSGMDLAVTLRAKTSSLVRMKREAGTLQDAFDKYVTPRIFSLLREAGKGVEQSQDFFKDEVQNQMQDFMLSNLKEQLDPLGFDVKIALFSDVTLPPLVQKAIENTKDRQEKVNQEKAQLEIVELEQQKTVKIADAGRDAAISKAASVKTMADANAYKTRADADANAYKTRANADADAYQRQAMADANAYKTEKEETARATANILLAKSISPELIDYVRANNWNGVRSQTVLAPNATPMLNLK